MCLYLDDDIRAKAKKPDKDGYCMAWKVLLKNNESPYKHLRYKVGKNAPRCKRLIGNVDNQGLHLFLGRKSAREEILSWGDEARKDLKIIKVFYKPEDVVAYGTYDWDFHPCVVVRKLLVKSLEPVK